MPELLFTSAPSAVVSFTAFLVSGNLTNTSLQEFLNDLSATVGIPVSNIVVSFDARSGTVRFYFTGAGALEAGSHLLALSKDDLKNLLGLVDLSKNNIPILSSDTSGDDAKDASPVVAIVISCVIVSNICAILLAYVCGPRATTATQQKCGDSPIVVAQGILELPEQEATDDHALNLEEDNLSEGELASEEDVSSHSSLSEGEFLSTLDSIPTRR